MHRSIEARLHYAALLVALTIHDICSALTLLTSVFVREKHYVAFVNRYTTEAELGLSGLSCYRLRGGIVHRANLAGHDLMSATHVIFTVPESERGVHGLSIETESGDKRAAMLDL